MQHALSFFGFLIGSIGTLGSAIYSARRAGRERERYPFYAALSLGFGMQALGIWLENTHPSAYGLAEAIRWCGIASIGIALVMSAARARGKSRSEGNAP
jgi:hypothetical protein